MKLIPLTSDYEMKPFDCGDDALNGFLLNEATFYAEKRLAKTFLLCDGETIAGFFCLLNDKISRQEVSKATWRKIKKLFPHSKHFGSYPAVKIGRFAIALQYRNQHLGNSMMSLLKLCLNNENSHSTFRFLTVDAYPDAIPFYERNGFVRLTSAEDPSGIRPMYFDMMNLPVSS